MNVYIKVGTHSAMMMKVMYKRKPPKVGDMFLVRDLHEPRALPIRVLCDEIRDIDGRQLYFVERM